MLQKEEPRKPVAQVHAPILARAEPQVTAAMALIVMGNAAMAPWAVAAVAIMVVVAAQPVEPVEAAATPMATIVTLFISRVYRKETEE